MSRIVNFEDEGNHDEYEYYQALRQTEFLHLHFSSIYCVSLEKTLQTLKQESFKVFAYFSVFVFILSTVLTLTIVIALFSSKGSDRRQRQERRFENVRSSV